MVSATYQFSGDSKYIHRLHTYICTHQNDDDDNEDSNEEEVLIIMAFLGSE